MLRTLSIFRQTWVPLLINPKPSGYGGMGYKDVPGWVILWPYWREESWEVESAEGRLVSEEDPVLGGKRMKLMRGRKEKERQAEEEDRKDHLEMILTGE